MIKSTLNVGSTICRTRGPDRVKWWRGGKLDPAHTNRTLLERARLSLLLSLLDRSLQIPQPLNADSCQAPDSRQGLPGLSLRLGLHSPPLCPVVFSFLDRAATDFSSCQPADTSVGRSSLLQVSSFLNTSLSACRCWSWRTLTAEVMFKLRPGTEGNAGV